MNVTLSNIRFAKNNMRVFISLKNLTLHFLHPANNNNIDDGFGIVTNNVYSSMPMKNSK